MKKWKLLFLAFTMLLSLTACGKSEAAVAADSLIMSIGDVTLDSDAKLTEAKSAVDALSEKERGTLDHLELLENAIATYQDLLHAKDADDFEAKIEELQNLTAEDLEKVTKLRQEFDEKDPQVQERVENLDKLKDAEQTVMALCAEKVSGLIAQIGEVTLNSENAIQTAQDAYDALPAKAQELVTNKDLLSEAYKKMDELQIAQGEKLLSSFKAEEDKVRGITFYYSNVQPYYADTRSYVLPYIGRDGNNVWLCADYHYTSDSWLFFNKITFAVDDQRFYKSFSYGDVVRDNDTEIWEFVNTADVSENDIDMFWAIANSNETIVRFEGDEYYDDFVVSSKDKQAIRDILTAYEYLTKT